MLQSLTAWRLCLPMVLRQSGVLMHMSCAGVGIEERHKKQRPKKEESDKPVPAPEIERPLWEDVTDPTERLALALGLDPRQLAIHTGRLTTDRCVAVCPRRTQTDCRARL